jgi:hypothetical protein
MFQKGSFVRVSGYGANPLSDDRTSRSQIRTQVVRWAPLGVPNTRLSRAASTTALVTSFRVLISRIRWIWVSRRVALHFRQQVAIETELEDRARFRFAGELGVDGFIGPAAEPACYLNAAQDIRPAPSSRDASGPPG